MLCDILRLQLPEHMSTVLEAWVHIWIPAPKSWIKCYAMLLSLLRCMFPTRHWVSAYVLQSVLSEDFKANEIEVGVVQEGVQGGAFRVLSVAEVEEHLTAISERDW